MRWRRAARSCPNNPLLGPAQRRDQQRQHHADHRRGEEVGHLLTTIGVGLGQSHLPFAIGLRLNAGGALCDDGGSGGGDADDRALLTPSGLGSLRHHPWRRTILRRQTGPHHPQRTHMGHASGATPAVPLPLRLADPITHNARSTPRSGNTRISRPSITTARYVPIGEDLPAQQDRQGSLRFGASKGMPLVKKT